jgi:hypothetical protein
MDRYWTRYSSEFESAGFSRREVIEMRPAQRRDTLALLLASTDCAFRHRDDAPQPRHRKVPSGASGLSVRRFRRLGSLSEAASAENVAADGLIAHWHHIVADLSAFDAPGRICYAQQIRAACRELGPEPDRGIAVAVLVPSGARISRAFAPDAPGDALYVWCAGDETMVKEMVRPGTFVIVAASGKAIRVGLLNVRLI